MTCQSHIILGDCLEEMQKMEDNSISSILTDPPYGLKLMGINWDKGIPGMVYWKEALRICREGAFLLAFGGRRTFHRLTCAIEDAGWEIIDCLMWLYGSGFPRSRGHLKPAWEPVIMARKKGILCHLNVDECRIKSADSDWKTDGRSTRAPRTKNVYGRYRKVFQKSHPNGRWPANLLLDEDTAQLLGEPSRFFYSPKASPSERGEENTHPTVKPLKLIEYLIKLIMPPKDGLLLDPFVGSGTTLLAARNLGYEAIGIEKDEEYYKIAKQRCA